MANQWRYLEENAKLLENVNWTHVELASCKVTQQKS